MIYDTVIIGGGVTGTAISYLLTQYTNVKNIALVEKYKQLATVNSANWNNSQTLHFGDIETNYTLEKATKVKDAADLVKNYLKKHDKNKELHTKTKKMVLGVGKEQVKILEKRYDEFKDLFPELTKLYKKELIEVEPNVIKGRNPQEEVMAMASTDGYAVDFGKLSRSFIKNSKKEKLTCFMGCEVWEIKKRKDYYELKVCNEIIKAKTVMSAMGSHSLRLAQKLGYADDIILLPVAGSFYRGKKLLNNKVYTLQMDKLPFAAIHGDPDVNNPHETRFGPTAKVLPILERRKISSFICFMKIFQFRIDAILSLLKIISDPILFRYIFGQFMLDMPIIGRRLFLKEVQKIIPSAKLSDISFAKELGGIRPQIVNVKEKRMDLGDAKIYGENIIFSITPSPGATNCLKNAENDTRTLIKMLGKNYQFNQEAFTKNYRTS